MDVEVSDEEAEDSVSLVDLLNGKDEPVQEDVVHSSGNGGLSIRRGFWKLTLVNNGGGFSELEQKDFRPTELYDLREDISETNNVIADYPDVVEELTQRLAEQVERGRSTEGKEQENERNNPTGDWKQINWLTDYDEYIKRFKNQRKKEDNP